jgi:hypothetical protein
MFNKNSFLVENFNIAMNNKSISMNITNVIASDPNQNIMEFSCEVCTSKRHRFIRIVHIFRFLKNLKKYWVLNAYISNSQRLTRRNLAVFTTLI